MWCNCNLLKFLRIFILNYTKGYVLEF